MRRRVSAPRPCSFGYWPIRGSRDKELSRKSLLLALQPKFLRAKKVQMDVDHYIQPIIDYVRVHQAWAAPIVFALCFAESLAFISLLIPAWAALVGIGAIISASDLNFWPIWIAGSIGAACGDWLSYWVGLKLENRVYHMWPLSQHPTVIPAGEAFIRKWGAFAIFIGRFSGPLRASVPLVAGVFAMPYWRFQVANFTSAFVWAATLLTLGDVTSSTIKWLAKLMGG